MGSARHHHAAGATRHPPQPARTSPRPVPCHPHPALAALDGDALDIAIGAYLAERDHTNGGIGSALPPAIAVDGKALSGSAHRQRRHQHLLSAVTLAQREVEAQDQRDGRLPSTAGTTRSGSAGVAFNALHSVKDQVRWLVEEKRAHYIAVIKGNQPTELAQVKALPWEQVLVAHTVSGTEHGRRESCSVKIMAIAANLGGIAYLASAAGLAHPPAPPGARQAAEPEDGLRRHQPRHLPGQPC